MYTKIFMKNTRMKQKKKWYLSATVHGKVLTSATKGRNEKKKKKHHSLQPIDNITKHGCAVQCNV